MFELINFSLKLVDLILKFLFIKCKAKHLLFNSAFAERFFFFLFFGLLHSDLELPKFKFKVVSFFIVVVFMRYL